MTEIKIHCVCGAKYKFDVEPVNGRMPGPVQCPTCGADGTAAANGFLAQNPQPASGAPATVAARGPSGLNLRLAGATSGTAPSAPVAAMAPAPAPGSSALRLAGQAPSVPSDTSSSSQTAESAPGHRPLLQRTTFFVKERVAILKLTDAYDILDPQTGQTIGIAKEEPPGWAKWLRLVIQKHAMPTTVNIYEYEGQPPVLSVHRGFTFLRSKIRVIAGHGESLGYFKSKLFSIGGGFYVFDNADQQVAEVKGNWKGWDFRFLSKSGREIGTVTKKWAGLGKELFTSADNYIIALTDLSGASSAASALLLAAGLAIDIVFKEHD
jgi:uncharacterized protein YxjI